MIVTFRLMAFACTSAFLLAGCNQAGNDEYQQALGCWKATTMHQAFAKDNTLDLGLDSGTATKMQKQWEERLFLAAGKSGISEEQIRKDKMEELTRDEAVYKSATVEQTRGYLIKWIDHLKNCSDKL